MRLTGFLLLAASSLLLLTLLGRAETRPQYGGTLQVSVREAPTTLDPADTSQQDNLTARNITKLIFETLVTTDDNGRISHGLATWWMFEAAGSFQSFQFRLRQNVMFHDGTPLIPAIAAASLRTANPSWKITSNADSITIECDLPCPYLPEELALPRNAIVKKSSDGKLSGTGPFHITQWQPGKKLVLGAEENYWAGRPFLDEIDIEFGKGFREQLVSLEMGKSDLIEIPAEQSRRISTINAKLWRSAPLELIAIVFNHDAQSPAEKSLRDALALSVEHASIGSVILQGAGQPAASLLPNWMSGYSFAFSAENDLPRARQLRAEMRTPPLWTISYDPADPIAGLLAERIALNARDAGLQLQPTKSAAADLRLARIPLPSDPITALNIVATAEGLPAPQINSDSAEDLYSAEREMLATKKLIPLFHLPVVYADTPAMHGGLPRQDGMWNLPDVWLSREPTGSDHP
jgi:peptide/nickel transport system substrate-binding protein